VTNDSLNIARRYCPIVATENTGLSHNFPSTTGTTLRNLPNHDYKVETKKTPDDAPLRTNETPDDVLARTNETPDEVPVSATETPDEVLARTHETPDDILVRTQETPDDVPVRAKGTPDDIPVETDLAVPTVMDDSHCQQSSIEKETTIPDNLESATAGIEISTTELAMETRPGDLSKNLQVVSSSNDICTESLVGILGCFLAQNLALFECHKYRELRETQIMNWR